MREQRTYESIKYSFNPDEIRDLGEALAREGQVLIDVKDRKKTAVAAFAAQIQAVNERCVELITKINNGFELREVECLVLMEEPRPGMKRIIRADTNEVIRDEAMTAKEMQGHFGFQDPGAGES